MCTKKTFFMLRMPSKGFVATDLIQTKQPLALYSHQNFGVLKIKNSNFTTYQIIPSF